MKQRSLKKFIYLSIAAALLTIGLKFSAYIWTGSVGLLSDALESVVNLFAAVIALIMIHIAERPADEQHRYGHTKAEYFSSMIEGVLIFIAAITILWSAVPKLIKPQEIENVGVGLLFSVLAALVNLGVGLILVKGGKRHNSLLVEADGKHLIADVLTSVGVIVAILLVQWTGVLIFDPIIAILIAVHIIGIGIGIMRRSANGLMDIMIPENEFEDLKKYLRSLRSDDIDFHSLMTRQAGQRKFITFHLLVPGNWSVKEGHDFAEKVERTVEDIIPGLVNVTTHIEPIEDPVSMLDIGIDRKSSKPKS